VVAGTILLVGSAVTVSRRWVVTLVVAQLIGGVIGTTLAAPDEVNRAESGAIDLGLTDGILLNDLRCRLDDLDRGEWPDGTSAAEVEESQARAYLSFACQTSSWRAEP
jgi:hypothetical protein